MKQLLIDGNPVATIRQTFIVIGEHPELRRSEVHVAIVAQVKAGRLKAPVLLSTPLVAEAMKEPIDQWARKEVGLEAGKSLFPEPEKPSSLQIVKDLVSKKRAAYELRRERDLEVTKANHALWLPIAREIHEVAQGCGLPIAVNGMDNPTAELEVVLTRKLHEERWNFNRRSGLFCISRCVGGATRVPHLEANSVESLLTLVLDRLANLILESS